MRGSLHVPHSSLPSSRPALITPTHLTQMRAHRQLQFNTHVLLRDMPAVDCLHLGHQSKYDARGPRPAGATPQLTPTVEASDKHSLCPPQPEPCTCQIQCVAAIMSQSVSGPSSHCPHPLVKHIAAPIMTCLSRPMMIATSRPLCYRQTSQATRAPPPHKHCSRQATCHSSNPATTTSTSTTTARAPAV